MKIMKHLAHSTQQQDSANHFSKTLHTASKAKIHQPNNANGRGRANAACSARLQARAEAELQAANSQQERSDAAWAARLQAQAEAEIQAADSQQERSNAAWAARLQAQADADRLADLCCNNLLGCLQAEAELQAANSQQERSNAAWAARLQAQADAPVSRTTDDIRAKLARGGNITHDQLEEIASSFDNLTPEQAQQVIEGLSDDELQTLANEMRAGGMFGFTGLTESARLEFIGTLASKLDAQQFQRVAEAFREISSPEQWEIIIDTVAQQGTSEQLISFMQVLNDEVKADPNPKHTPMLDATMLMAAVGNSSSSLDVRDEFLAAVGEMDQFKGVAQLEQFSGVWGQNQDRRFAVAVMLMQDASLTPEGLIHDQDMALLASAVYGETATPEYYQSVDFGDDDLDPRLDGLSMENFENEFLGFSSKLYLDTRYNTYVLVFRGTDEPKDFATANFPQGAGNVSVPYAMAVALAQELQQRLGSDLTDIAGHSLGGGQAAAASIWTGIPATTFDAAGVHPNTVIGSGKTLADDGNITNYRVRGEILTWVQEESPTAGLLYDAVGKQITVELFNDNNHMVTGERDNTITRRVDIHYPEFFVRALLTEYP